MAIIVARIIPLLQTEMSLDESFSLRIFEAWCVRVVIISFRHYFTAICAPTTIHRFATPKCAIVTTYTQFISHRKAIIIMDISKGSNSCALYIFLENRELVVRYTSSREQANTFVIILLNCAERFSNLTSN